MVFEDESIFDEIRRVLLTRARASEKRLLQTPDQIYLDLEIRGCPLRLHWDVFAGLVLIAVEKSSEAILEDIGQLLVGRGFEEDRSHPSMRPDGDAH